MNKKPIFDTRNTCYDEPLFSDRLEINGTGGPLTEEQRRIWKIGFKRGRGGWG